MAVLIILSRWLHIVTACLVVGGVFSLRFIFPAGQSMLEPDLREAIFLKTRRVFKMLIHSAILLLLITGAFNTYVAWNAYSLNPPLLHSLWGAHVLLAFIAFGVVLYVLAGRLPRPGHQFWMALCFLVLLAVIAVASTLKWAREKTLHEQSAARAAILQ